MDHSDPFGLYRILGLAPSATMEEIAAAKSRPYYIPSGDESDKAFAEAFRRANEAYEILNDPTRRASYDQFASNPPEQAKEADGTYRYDLSLIPDGPIRCSKCGKSRFNLAISRCPASDLDMGLTSSPMRHWSVQVASVPWNLRIRRSRYCLDF